MGLEELECGDPVLHHDLAVQLPLQGPALVVVAGVAAQGREGVGAQRHEVGGGEAAHHVLDVGVQAPVLVDHQHGRLGLGGTGGEGQKPPHGARALGGGVFHVLGFDPSIVGWHLLCPRVPGLERLQDPEGGGSTAEDFGGALEEVPALDEPVHVAVEELQHLLREVAGLLALHGHLALLGSSWRSRPEYRGWRRMGPVPARHKALCSRGRPEPTRALTEAEPRALHHGYIIRRPTAFLTVVGLSVVALAACLVPAT